MEEKDKSMATPIVSVIVPIYKVRRFIARCADSLLGQTLQNVEFIFVNDCTPDDSMDVLAGVINNYPNRNNAIKIINHDVNKGLPTARNTGLSVATGKYIFHCDSDDYVEYDMLEKMVEVAESNDADFVWCNWYMSFEHRERYMKEPCAFTPSEVLSNILCGIMKYNVWNKLIKREVYEQSGVCFPDGYGMGEDMTIIRLLPHIKRVAYVNEALYHYVRLNATSFTTTYSSTHLVALQYNVQQTIEYLKFYTNVSDRDVAFFCQCVKLPFIISENSDDYYIWNIWYPESNKYIWQNGNMPLRTRVLQWCVSRKFYKIVKMYNWLLNNIYYRLSLMSGKNRDKTT